MNWCTECDNIYKSIIKLKKIPDGDFILYKKIQ